MSSPAPTTKELLNRLASWKPSVRESAIEQAKQLEPDALLALMQQGRRRLQRRQRFRWLIFGIYFFGGIIAAHILGREGLLIGKYIDRLVPFIIVFNIVALEMSHLNSSLIEVLEDVSEVVFIPHLVLLLSGNGYAFSRQVQQVQTTLTHIMLHLNREQADALTLSERQTLLKPLRQSLSADKRGKVLVGYVVAMLKALEQIGDQREAGLVEQLAAIPIRTDTDRQIQQAAIECLPYLQIRAEEQRLQTTLLRPTATAASDTGNDLLRAAVPATSAAPPEQLLRATRQE